MLKNRAITLTSLAFALLCAPAALADEARLILPDLDRVLGILREPVKDLGPLHYLSVGGAFLLQLKVSAVMGVIFAMPMLLYQMWAFISPGLTKPSGRRLSQRSPMVVAPMVTGYSHEGQSRCVSKR